VADRAIALMAMIVRPSSDKTLWRRWPPVLWFGRPILSAACLHLVASIWHFFQQSIEERAGQASAVPSGSSHHISAAQRTSQNRDLIANMAESGRLL
jgi:hypothetical protein